MPGAPFTRRKIAARSRLSRSRRRRASWIDDSSRGRNRSRIAPTAADAAWDAAEADWAKSGYRLPTEMEWMWAAMGAPVDGRDGGTNVAGYLKAFSGSDGSNSIGDYAVYGAYDDSKSAGQTATQRSNPVASKKGNELGLYDISGNVWEWCWDPGAAYPSGEVIDYRGPASGTNRVYRGGDWGRAAAQCTVGFRGSSTSITALPPYLVLLKWGFRVVRR